jgi:hypothetical protein
MEEILADAPTYVKRSTDLSHNSADAQAELIRIFAPFAMLVWNPFVTEIAKEAGKDVYAGCRQWVSRVLKKLCELREPICVIDSYQANCDVSFVFRGNDIGKHYYAHQEMPSAAAQADRLIQHLKERNLTPKHVIYEFSSSAGKWAPTYALLADGRIIGSRATLIAIEQVHSGISLGFPRVSRNQAAAGADLII